MSTASVPENAITLLLVDDHEVVRVGLSALLGREESIVVVGEAGTVADAISRAALLQPRVILMDLRLPDGSGIDACREILSTAPATRMLFLTSYSDEESVMATLLAGAAGYLLKEIGHTALVRAIRATAEGQRILDPKLEELMREDVQRVIDASMRGDGPDALSPQELRILSLVVEGQTNKEIAKALDLSDKTVKNYLSNAFQKLHVKRRAQAAAVFSKRRRSGVFK
jgi:two-component system, NarL family, response regulator DevR